MLTLLLGTVVSAAQKPITDFILGNIPCSMCRTITREIKDLRKQNLNKNEIQMMILEKCSQLPNVSRATCGIIAKDWFERLYNTNENARDTCSFVCKSDMHVPLYPQLRMAHKPVSRRKLQPEPLRMFDCTTCQMIAGYVMEQAPGIADEDASERFRNHCAEIEMFKNRCGLFTSEAVSRAVQYLTDNLVPYEICNHYSMC